MKRVVSKSILLGCACAFTLSAGSLTVGVDGGSNVFPFGLPTAGPGTQYQEAYSSTLFAGPISITGLDFFLEGPGNLYDATFTLSLSTITTDVNSLDDVNFNNNLGADNTVFTTVALSGAAPNVLTFTGGPFIYNPANGNLLLNIVITDIIGTGSASFEDGDGSGPATIARYTNFGDGISGFGLVTEFDYGAVATPEPAPVALVGCGMGILFLLRRFRRV